MIRFEHVSSTLTEAPQPALDDVSFHIPKGEFVWLASPTGQGASQALQLIHGALRPDNGQLTVDDIDVASLRNSDRPRLRRIVALVGQNPRLLSDQTAQHNVALGLLIGGELADVAARKARSALMDVGLGHRVRRPARELTEAERHLCALARALAMAPSVLLADEPTGRLDPELSGVVRDLLESAHRRGTTVLWATSRPELWKETPHRVLRFERGALVEDRPARDLGQWLPDFSAAPEAAEANP